MIGAAVEIDKSIQSIKPYKFDFPKEDIANIAGAGVIPVKFEMQPIDPEFVNKYKDLTDQQIIENTRLTTAELSNIALRKQATSDMFGNLAGAGQNFYQASGQQNKAAFAVYKAFAIAQAGIDTYQSAVAAYKAMVGIPIIGPGLAIAAAAAATAFGLSNIAKIAAMQPGSGASGGNVSAGSAPNINSPGNSTSNDNRSTVYQINFYGDPGNITDKDRFARDIIDSINKASRDGKNIAINSNYNR